MIGQSRDHRSRDLLELGALLTLDQLLLGRERGLARIVKRAVRNGNEGFVAGAVVHAPELAMRGRTQPRVDLALRLATAPALRSSAGLLKGLVEFVAGAAGVPRGDL